MKSAEPRAGLEGDSHFGALKSWIIRHTGLSYYSDKDRDFAAAIERSYESSPPTALTILKRVAADRDGELDRIIEELTIGETFFFRHAEMFEALRTVVFPDLLKHKGVPHLRIWSAGCSIGAEPYSLAILLRDLARLNKIDLTIEIIDTGPGFDPTMTSPLRLGITSSILGRVNSHPSCQAAVMSRPGAGTRVVLTWTLP